MQAEPIKKKTKGRQKIDIRPIEIPSNLHVTFSKRRSGLINKATELSVLCGCQTAVIVFSPGNKAFSFGFPDVDSVIDRYKEDNRGRAGTSTSLPSTDIIPAIQLQQWSKEYDAALSILEEEKRRTNEGSQSGFWWNDPIDHLRVDELEAYVRGLHELKTKVRSKFDKLNESRLI